MSFIIPLMSIFLDRTQSKENTLHLIVVVLCRYQNGIKPTNILLGEMSVREKNGDRADKSWEHFRLPCKSDTE